MSLEHVTNTQRAVRSLSASRFVIPEGVRLPLGDPLGQVMKTVVSEQYPVTSQTVH